MPARKALPVAACAHGLQSVQAHYGTASRPPAPPLARRDGHGGGGRRVGGGVGGAGAATEPGAYQPATAPAQLVQLSLRSGGSSFSDEPQQSCQARPGARLAARQQVGAEHNTLTTAEPLCSPLTPLHCLLRCRPCCAQGQALQLQPPSGLSVSRQELEDLALAASRRAEEEERSKRIRDKIRQLKIDVARIVQRGKEMALERRRDEEEAQQRAAQQRKATPAPPHQPVQAPAPRPGPSVWDPATAQASPTAAMSRLRAAEASAAAATAWATKAAAHEAAAAAAKERGSSLPATQHTAGAEEWEWAAAAWQAAYRALEAARQACSDAPAVRQAEAAVAAAAALRALQRGQPLCGADDGGQPGVGSN